MTFNLSTYRQVLIVDTAVSNYQALVASVHSDTEVIVLNAEQDGIEQITQALKTRRDIQTLHILSHGEAGALQLSNICLDANSLEQYASRIKQWAIALSEDANVLLYGCKVAANETGQQFVQQLSRLIKAPIAAATHLIGDAAQGGNWQLDFTTGTVTAPLAFSAAAMQSYESVLVTFLTETFTGSDVADKNWLFGVDVPTNPSRANPYLTARSEAAPWEMGRCG
jgi:hypothetical protein